MHTGEKAFPENVGSLGTCISERNHLPGSPHLSTFLPEDLTQNGTLGRPVDLYIRLRCHTSKIVSCLRYST